MNRHAFNPIRISSISKVSWHALLLALVFLTISTTKAQFTYYTTAGGEAIVTGYTGSMPDVTIPGTIDNLTVIGISGGAFNFKRNIRSVKISENARFIDIATFALSSISEVDIPSTMQWIGSQAFYVCDSLKSITIPGSVAGMGGEVFTESGSLTNVTFLNGCKSFGVQSFLLCRGLVSLTLPDSLDFIPFEAFVLCESLPTVIVPNSVTNIEARAFVGGSSLASATIGKGILNIEAEVFAACPKLRGVLFQGNAPIVNPSAFESNTNATIYYLPGTTGWGPTLAGRPTALWNPTPVTSDANFGVRAGRFGFTITGTSGITVVVEADSDLLHPNWTPLKTNTLTSGSAYFSDSQWTNFPSRIYRFRSP